MLEMAGVMSGKLLEIGACICSYVDLHMCVCGSAHRGCVVNGMQCFYGSCLSINIVKRMQYHKNSCSIYLGLLT